jgi:hypothetical protein
MISQRMKRVARLAFPARYVIACLIAGVGFTSPAAAQDASGPDSLAIWSDDIGWYKSAPTTWRDGAPEGATGFK